MKSALILTTLLLGSLLGTVRESRAVMSSVVDASRDGSASFFVSDAPEMLFTWNARNLANITLRQIESSSDWFYGLVLKDSIQTLIDCDAQVPLAERVLPASEPSPLLLLGSALAGLALFGKRRKIKQDVHH